MEIKPMGNTEQEKMSSLWGYFIAVSYTHLTLPTKR